jgi:hypothetical protein
VAALNRDLQCRQLRVTRIVEIDSIVDQTHNHVKVLGFAGRVKRGLAHQIELIGNELSQPNEDIVSLVFGCCAQRAEEAKFVLLTK